MQFIDTHAHYTSPRFKADRNELIKKLLNGDLKYIIECGTNIKFNKLTLDLCHKYDKVFGTIGFFPDDIGEINPETLAILEKQLQDPKIVGLGEIGLDYNHRQDNKKEQVKYFEIQLELAKKLDLPVCIHSRDAKEDTIDVLKNFGKYKGVIHCFSYDIKTMQVLYKLGYKFGVGGTSTYNNRELDTAISAMPLTSIVLETDAPYLTPKPVRGKRNDSSNIQHVINHLAKVKHVPVEKIIEQTNLNAINIYPKLN